MVSKALPGPAPLPLWPHLKPSFFLHPGHASLLSACPHCHDSSIRSGCQLAVSGVFPSAPTWLPWAEIFIFQPLLRVSFSEKRFPFLSLSFFSFFLSKKKKQPHLQHMKVPRPAVWMGAAASTTPPSQQHQIQAASLTYATIYGNARSLTHGSRPGIEPASSRDDIGSLTSWATTGTLEKPFLIPHWQRVFIRILLKRNLFVYVVQNRMAKKVFIHLRDNEQTFGLKTLTSSCLVSLSCCAPEQIFFFFLNQAELCNLTAGASVSLPHVPLLHENTLLASAHLIFPLVLSIKLLHLSNKHSSHGSHTHL